jgi:hypothetical protein
MFLDNLEFAMKIGKEKEERIIEHPSVPSSPGEMPAGPAPAEPSREPAHEPAPEPAIPVP